MKSFIGRTLDHLPPALVAAVVVEAVKSLFHWLGIATYTFFLLYTRIGKTVIEYETVSRPQATTCKNPSSIFQ